MILTGFDISENEKDDFFQKTSGDVIYFTKIWTANDRRLSY
jgi:hypothetical protein